MKSETPLHALVARVVRPLKAIEWSASDSVGRTGSCPACHQEKRHGHTVACSLGDSITASDELAALLLTAGPPNEKEPLTCCTCGGETISQLSPTTECPDGEAHVLRCIRCELPATGLTAGPQETFTDDEINEVLAALYRDGEFSLALADKVCHIITRDETDAQKDIRQRLIDATQPVQPRAVVHAICPQCGTPCETEG